MLHDSDLLLIKTGVLLRNLILQKYSILHTTLVLLRPDLLGIWKSRKWK